MKTCLTLVIMLALAGAALANPRDDISAAYNKQVDAARWKFMPGMWSARRLDFVGYNSRGKVVAASQEATSMQQLLDAAVSVQETVSIVSFRQVDSHHAQCRVRDTMQFNRAGDKVPPLVLDCLSDDDWVLGRGRWGLQRSRILQQTLQRGPGPQSAPEGRSERKVR